jgi:hypothetical protein
MYDALLRMNDQIYYLNGAPMRDMRHSPTVEAADKLIQKMK